MESLLVGIDLGRRRSQISVYEERKGEIEGVSPFPSEDEGLIPTVLGVTREKEWIYGRECERQECELIPDFLERAARGEGASVYGVDFSPESLLEKFLKKLLLLVKARHPLNNITKLAIAIERKSPRLEAALREALGKLGIGRERAHILTYEESYVTYALSQRKELWFSGVALFDFGEGGLFYRQISIHRESDPMVVCVEEKDKSDAMSFGMLEAESAERLSYMFLNVATEALHKQDASTVYVTGAGFQHPFAEDALPKLCRGRRVFAGQNLYSRGACYRAMELAGRRKAPPYLFMGEGIVASHVLLPVYKDGREEALCLCRFGTPWQEAGGEAEVILEEDEEIPIIVRDPLKKKERTLIVPLPGLPRRQRRMTRLSVSLRFLGERELVVTVRDLGFGAFEKSSHRIWEKRVEL